MQVVRNRHDSSWSNGGRSAATDAQAGDVHLEPARFERPQQVHINARTGSSDRGPEQSPPTDWPDFEVIAERLRVSPSPLRQHLHEEGQR